MEKFNHKVIVDPELVTYLNRMDSEYTNSLVDSINAAAHAVDDICRKYQQDRSNGDLSKPQVTVKINAPFISYRSDDNPKGFKDDLDKINNYFDDNSFKKSSNYRDLMGMVKFYSKDLSDSRNLDRIKVDRYEVDIDLCLSHPSKHNQIIKGSDIQISKVYHYVFTFKSKEFTGMMDIDLPPMIKSSKPWLS